MAHSDFDAEEVAKFIRFDDRALNPCFAGRHDLIKEIKGRSKDISDRTARASANNYSYRSAPGLTQVIQGSPGIGKTSLMEKIESSMIKDWGDSHLEKRTVPVVITTPMGLSYDSLCINIHASAQRIARKFPRLRIHELLGNLFENINSMSMKLQGHVGEIGGEISGKITRTPDKTLVPKGVTILLLIDEIQSIDLVTSQPRAGEIQEIIQFLHNGSNGNPILPVMGGLSNSCDIIEKRGSITRLADKSVDNIQPLSEFEVRSSFGKFIRYFNIRAEPEIIRIWSDRVVRLADY